MEILTTQYAGGPLTKVGSEPRSAQGPESASGDVRTTDLRHSFKADLLGPTQSSSDVTPMSYRRTERMGLVIQTQEGDLVRVRFKANESMSPSSDDAQSVEAEEGERTFDSTFSSKISMKIHGQLSGDELGAIQDAFDRAAQLAEEFFSGGLRAAFDSASALQMSGDQLARVTLRASFRETVTYSREGLGSLPAGEQPVSESTEGEPTARVLPPGEGPQSSRVAAPRVLPPGEGPQATEVTPEEAGRARRLPESELPAAERLRKAVEPHVEGPALEITSPKEPDRVISDFLGKLTDRFMPGEGQLRTGVIDSSLKIRMFESVLETISEGAAKEESSLPPLVSETLDALASREQRPVDALA